MGTDDTDDDNPGDNRPDGRTNGRPLAAAAPGTHPAGGGAWLRCDLHAHSPAASDFEDRGATPERWLDAAREAGLDAVAVTDHNTGGWIDRLLRASAAAGGDGRGTVAVLPGVELTVATGEHLVALFPESGGTAAVESFLAACGARSPGRDAPAKASFLEALEAATERGGATIAPPLLAKKGLHGKRGFGAELERALASPHLDAVELDEWRDLEHESWDELERLLAILGGEAEGGDALRRERGPLPILTGSDAHRLEDLGRRATLIRAPAPTFAEITSALRIGPATVRSWWEMEALGAVEDPEGEEGDPLLDELFGAVD